MFRLKLRTTRTPERVENAVGDMLSCLTGRHVYVEEIEVMSLGEKRVYFYVEFDSTNPKDMADLFKALEDLEAHKYFPIEGFEDVSVIDYTVSVTRNDDENPFATIIAENEQEFSRINVEVMRTIMKNEIAKRAELEDEVNSIKEFLNQSGLLYYKALNEHIINKLDDNKILSKDELKSEIFTTIH